MRLEPVTTLEPSAATVGAALSPSRAEPLTVVATPPLPLFRAEALEQRRAQWLGAVLLAPQLSHRIYTAVAVVAAAAILALLFGASYTRTARLSGWLVPPQGVVRVMAQRPGVVTALHVAEGATVRKGQSLVTLSDELQSAAVGGVQAEVARRLDERQQSLLDERDQQRSLLVQQQRALTQRMGAMRAEAAQFEREIEVLKARVAIAERNQALHREQFKQGFISEMRLQIVESEALEQVARLRALERNLMSLKRDILTAGAELNDLPLKQGREISTLERSAAQLSQERAEAEGRRELVVLAPGDGTVTAIQAVIGAAAGGTSAPLMSIVPAHHKLEAHLYGPSRAVGFVRPGQRVRVRYQAFPYQRFGHHEGRVASVSRTAVSPADLPAPLAAAGTGNAAVGTTGTAVDPIYRIVVEIESQAVTAYGQPIVLQPGMALEADISLEKRRLFEWVLEPVYAITGKWQ